MLPAATAKAIFFIDNRKGELKGAMPAMTPKGRRTDSEICRGIVIGMVSPKALVQTPRARHSCGYGSWRGKG